MKTNLDGDVLIDGGHHPRGYVQHILCDLIAERMTGVAAPTGYDVLKAIEAYERGERPKSLTGAKQ